MTAVGAIEASAPLRSNLGNLAGRDVAPVRANPAYDAINRLDSPALPPPGRAADRGTF